MTRILVTGGAGFIGRHLVAALSADGGEVLVVDDLSSSRSADFAGKSVYFEKEDINARRFADLVQLFRPQVVFHLAARISVRQSVVAPAADAEANLIGTIKVFEAARNAGCGRVVMASSGGAVYGECHGRSAREDDAVAPQSPYGLSKLAAEMYSSWFSKHSAVQTTVLRLANVYGPGQGEAGEAGVVAILLQTLLCRQIFCVFGDGEQTRDFIYVDCVVDALRRAAAPNAPSGIFNVSSGKPTSLHALIDAACEAVGVQRQVVYQKQNIGEVRHSVLSWQKAQALLGWQPMMSLADGLAAVAVSLAPREASHLNGRGVA